MAGAISIRAPASLDVTGGTFIGNHATGDGGAVFCDSPSGGGTVIDGSTFIGNTAAGDGGAIYDFSAGGESISNSLIKDNSASFGRRRLLLARLERWAQR